MFAFLKKVSENEDLFGMGPTLKLPLVSTLTWMTLDHVYGANANKLGFFKKRNNSNGTYDTVSCNHNA